MKQRTAARVLLLDDLGRVLLVRFAFPQTTGTLHFWAAPGGGLNPGEAPLDGARRELMEELGIAPALRGPVHAAEGEFEYEGELVRNRDLFFTARWQRQTPTLGGVTPLERDAMREVRWWSAEDLRQSHETIYPAGLADLLGLLSLQPADE